MKTPAKKVTKTAGKPSAKVSAPAKKVPAKSPVKAKAAAKPAKPAPGKAKAKPASKAAAKAPTKKAVSPAAKKVAAKKEASPAAKKVAAKKVPAKKVPAKKVVAKKVPAKKAVARTSPARKGLANTAPPKKAPASKASAKTVPVKKAVPANKPAVAKPVAAAKPVAKAKAPTRLAPAAKPPTAAKSAAPVVAAPVQAVTAADLPARSSRPSARLAQITVPSMPQAVASTAAKASFLPQMTPTVLPVAAAPAKKDPKLANNWKNKPLEQLTDAEMLAMPDSEYMNDVQMAFFRLKLVQLKQGILNNAGETTEHLREDTVVVPDPADRATIEEEHALELRTRDRERKLLKKIEQSIARIDAGDYGYCDETGEPIGVGRLLARPTATLSLEAQQRRELKQKMFGD